LVLINSCNVGLKFNWQLLPFSGKSLLTAAI